MDLFRRSLQKIMEKLLPPFECEGLGLRLSVTSPEGARSGGGGESSLAPSVEAVRAIVR